MILKYKNYIGKVEYDQDEKVFNGSVIGIRDIITFTAKKEKDLAKALQESVEDYIDFCKETGKIPEKSRSGHLRLRIDPKIHAELAAEAAYKGISLNSYLNQKLVSRKA